MNLDSLLTWSRKALGFVAAPRPVPGVSWETDALEERMGWIQEHLGISVQGQRLRAIATVSPGTKPEYTGGLIQPVH